LNDWISSAARLRLATSCDDASRLVSRKSFRLERRSSPRATSAVKFDVLRSSAEATVRLMPTGLLTSWATPPPAVPSASFFRLDQRVLRLAQVPQRPLRRILGLAHLEFDALALADVERNGHDVLDLAGRHPGSAAC
jgi:hypothetical protein